MYVNPQRRNAILGMIEILNDMGYSITFIGDQFLIFTEFIPVEEGIVEITIYGRDITSIVENAVDNVSFDDIKKRELITRIDQISLRRRVFSPGTQYIKYIS